MKKILAGLLATASLMAMTVSASATTDKNITKAGEVTYDVAVTAPKVVLNLVMPAKMAASLNPYGAEIKFDDAGTNKSVKGIASVPYKVTNKSTDYGVYLDATAITTITTTDKKKADGSNAWDVKGITVTNGTKGACMSLLAIEAIADNPTAKASKAFASGEGALLLDSSAKADTTAKTPAGYTKQAKVAFVKANDGSNDGVVYLQFAGDLAKTQGTNEVVWNEDDSINVNLVLKVTAGPKALT